MYNAEDSLYFANPQDLLCFMKYMTLERPQRVINLRLAGLVKVRRFFHHLTPYADKDAIIALKELARSLNVSKILLDMKFGQEPIYFDLMQAFAGLKASHLCRSVNPLLE